MFYHLFHIKKFLVFLVFIFPGIASSQTDTLIFTMSLEELMQVKINLSSISTRTIQEQPGIVTVISSEQIEKSGARFLADVLRLVPGFDFGFDVMEQKSWGFRGIWADEGKILLMIDEQIVNDPQFGNVQFFNHFPVYNIKQIEIIRGPGSAMYGDYAELAVVKITSKSAGLNGISVSSTLGSMENTDQRRSDIVVNFGKEYKNGGIAINLHSIQSPASDVIFKATSGKTYDMGEESRNSSEGINLGLSYRNLKFRFRADDHNIYMRSTYGDITDSLKFKAENPSWFSSLGYDIKLGEKLSLKPEFDFLNEQPHKDSYFLSKSSNVDQHVIFYNMLTQRATGKLVAQYHQSEKLDMLFGIEYNNIYGKQLHNAMPWSQVAPEEYFDGKQTVNYSSKSAFTQIEFYNSIVNITVGARFHTHSGISGNSIVPRIALTKDLGKVYFKALYSKAYRVGDIEHINLAVTSINPEKTKTAEFEAGATIASNTLIKFNAFYLDMSDPIVYLADNTTTNKGKLITSGIEGECIYRVKKFDAQINYSYYKVGDKTDLPSFTPIEKKGVFVGFPAHKVTFNLNYKLKNFTINSTAYAISERFRVSLDSKDVKEDPVFLWNAFVHYSGLKNMVVSVGVMDILDQKYCFLQGYNSGALPIPDASREFLIRINYTVRAK